MSRISGVVISLCMGFVGSAQDSPKTQFTARELFYYAPPAAKAQAPATAPKPAPKPPAPRSTATPPKPVQVDSVSPAGHATQLPGGGRVVTTAATSRATAPAPTSGPPAGLKYTILKLVNGEMTEVAPDTVFHAGDRIRFNVETNGPGYLYIVSQGSSGEWRPLFPSTEVEDGNNHVDGFHAYTMPPKSRIFFDEQAGEEKVFIVFSREPETDLDNVFYRLQGGKAKQGPQPASTPAAPAAAPRQGLVASAAIDNSTVGHLRDAYARDLIVEKITEDTAGDRKEKSVYVVNPSGSQDSRVVADLTLVHK